MKRKRAWKALALVAAGLMLTGCAPEVPERTADGAPWDESRVTVGGVLSVEVLKNGLIYSETNEALSARGMYYAVWTAGEPQAYRKRGRRGRG